MRRHAWVLAGLLGLSVGCGGGSGDDDTGAGTDTADAGADGGADAGADGGDTDTGANTDWVGAPCELPDGGPDPCVTLAGSAEAFCFVWPEAVGGICTMPCTFATSANPVDGCGMDGVVCMDISRLTADTSDDAKGQGLCVERCVLSSAGDECRAGYIKCDPQSWSMEAMFATCLLPKCRSDEDCGVPGATCDTLTGRCSWTGNPGATIGNPCESTSDCGDNMLCLAEDTDADGKVMAHNGVCIKQGCDAVNQSSPNNSHSTDVQVIDRYGCTMFGECSPRWSGGGLCLRRCLPGNTNPLFDCRQRVWGTSAVLDNNGDYDCYDQSTLEFDVPAGPGKYPFAAGPFCQWVSESSMTRCQVYGNGAFEIADDCSSSSATTCITCAAYLGSSWGFGMECRDPVTGAPQADGYCLDQTPSGPTHNWP